LLFWFLIVLTSVILISLLILHVLVEVSVFHFSSWLLIKVPVIYLSRCFFVVSFEVVFESFLLILVFVIISLIITLIILSLITVLLLLIRVTFRSVWICFGHFGSFFIINFCWIGVLIYHVVVTSLCWLSSGAHLSGVALRSFLFKTFIFSQAFWIIFKLNCFLLWDLLLILLFLLLFQKLSIVFFLLFSFLFFFLKLFHFLEFFSWLKFRKVLRWTWRIGWII